MLAWSQDYMRQKDDECSFVSLRDVERAMVVFVYFVERMETLFGQLIKKKAESESANNSEIDDITRSLLLSVSICYRARLQDRKEYDDEISSKLAISGGAEVFRSEIRRLVLLQWT